MKLHVITRVIDVVSSSMPANFVLSKLLIAKDCDLHSFLKAGIVLSHVYNLKACGLKALAASGPEEKPLIVAKSVSIVMG